MKSGSEKRTGADTPPRFRRRDWLIAAVAFALFLFCIAALLLLKLPRLGETFIERELRRRGLPDSECGVIALTPHRALLGPLRLGAEAGTPRARTAAVTYRLNALRRGSVDQVHLTGLELTLRYRDSAWRLVGLDALQRAMSSTAGAAAAAPPSPAALPPVQRVTVQDAELVLAHPTGNLRIAFTGAATFDAAGRVIFRATLSPNEDALQIRGSGDLNRGNLNVTLLPSRTRLEPWLAWLPLAGIMPPTPTPAVNGSVVIEAQAHWKDGRALDLRVDLHAPRVLIQEPWGQADLRDIRGRVEAGTDWRAATA